jgi:tetratricopeptide (TPR) repeat protein
MMIVVACLLGAGVIATHPQDADDFVALDQLKQLIEAGKYPEAADVGERALALAERQFGPDHVNVAMVLYGLGRVYYCQGRSVEAEALFTRGLAIIEKMPGFDDAMLAGALNQLAEVYEFQGRKAEAKPLRERARAIKTKAP